MPITKIVLCYPFKSLLQPILSALLSIQITFPVPIPSANHKKYPSKSHCPLLLPIPTHIPSANPLRDTTPISPEKWICLQPYSQCQPPQLCCSPKASSPSSPFHSPFRPCGWQEFYRILVTGEGTPFQGVPSPVMHWKVLPSREHFPVLARRRGAPFQGAPLLSVGDPPMGGPLR